MILLAAAAIAVGLALPARAEMQVREVTSPGGITAWLYEDHSIPMLNLEASFRGGSVLDPLGQEGAVSLMATLLGQGAAGLDATAFAEAREALAARFTYRAGRESVDVAAQVLSENRPASLALLRDSLSAPRFDAEPMARMKARRLSRLRQDETNPGAIAGQTFRTAVFAGHDYARPPEGTAASVTALDAEAMRAARSAALSRDRLQVVAVGDITAAELGPLLDEVFGALPATGAALPPPAVLQAAGQVAVVDLDIPQTVVLFGTPGPSRLDPDFVPAMVMNHMLGGGGFSSRLMQELRERRGLTYGVSTWLAPEDLGPTLMGRFSTGNARAGEAVGLVREGWAVMAASGVGDAELAAAKRYLTGAWPLRFDGNGRIAEQLISLMTGGLPPTYINERNARIEAVTREDIARVARRWLDPAALTVVAVGRPVGVEARINH